jgi:leucyl-tRNA synthetase
VELKGVRAVNPVTGGEIPIFLSDYVLASYGTGAIMAVPGHDTRDWEFAKKFDLPIIEVVKGGNVEEEAYIDCDKGILVNSGFLDGLPVETAIGKITDWLTDKGLGREKVNFKLRDWVFSRQRYWGEPIPIINCPKCGWVPMDEKDLPLVLPDVRSYEPTDTGESPLAHMREWVQCTCPKCGGPAEHETDTMPNWAGSSWYFLRYMDAHNDKALASEAAMDYWSPVDWYNGGMEHTTLHLLYSRFWHKFLYDIGVAPTKEPYQKRTSHGMILGEGGEKMSKSRGNVINPNDIVEKYGADTLRLYIMFIGDFEKAVPWSDNAVKGCKRFLDRIWNISEVRIDGPESFSAANEKAVNRTIKKVGDDIESMKFNTAIAALMTLLNQFSEHAPSRGDIRAFVTLLSPFAPHIAEELWELQGFGGGMACEQSWPGYDESKLRDEELEIAVQVNGKLRATVMIPADCDDGAAVETALAEERVAKFMNGMAVVKTIVIKNKLVNIIVKPAK